MDFTSLMTAIIAGSVSVLVDSGGVANIAVKQFNPVTGEALAPFVIQMTATALAATLTACGTALGAAVAAPNTSVAIPAAS